MTRPSLSLYLLTVCAIVLSAWLVFFGLQMRFFGTLFAIDGLFSFFTPPYGLAQWLGGLGLPIAAADLGWPLVVIGCSITGSLMGLWKKQTWALPSLVFFCLVSLITAHWMNLLSVLLVALTRSTLITRWAAQESLTHG